MIDRKISRLTFFLAITELFISSRHIIVAAAGG